MKLVTRLILLVSVTSLLFAAAIATYFVILSPIDTYEAEHVYFRNANAAITNLQIQVGRLLTDTFGNQRPNYNQAVTDYYNAIEDIGNNVVALPAINPELGTAVDTIKQLRQASETSFAALNTNLDNIAADAKNIFLDVDSAYIMKFYGSASKRADPEMLQAAQFHVMDLQDTMQSLIAFMAESAKTIQEKESAVAAEIAKVKAQAIQVVAIVAGFIVIFALLFAVFMSRGIVKAIHYLIRNMTILAQGDLSFRFAVRNKDEIGMLGRDLNQMIELMNTSMVNIQEAAKRNVGIRKELVAAVTDATSSAVEIEANSSSIRSQMERMDRMIESSSKDMTRVSSVIASFNERMAIQNNNVAEAVAAVTQMLASIENIARITDNNRHTTESLVQESEHGRSVFEDAFGRVSEITESVNAIQDMANVIADIATQTNILAMNAAIEAAHAGEFGKGFAVVADEISKLAAASASSSEEIAQTIKAVVLKFNEAASTKDTTISAFDLISSRIREVTDSVDEIYTNVSEMRTGSRQVLEATQQLRSSSSEITGESGKINADIGAVQHTFGEINRVSREVVSNISEITIGLHNITTGIQTVSDRTGELQEIGNSLDEAVSHFKTGCIDEDKEPC